MDSPQTNLEGEVDAMFARTDAELFALFHKMAEVAMKPQPGDILIVIVDGQEYRCQVL